jgi:malate dehydrogenase (NAD) (EC 1.1.1.37)
MKISIIGSGRLGSTAALEIINRDLVDDLVLIDIVKGLPQGEALDLNQMASEKGKNVKVIGSNDYKDIRDSNIVVITAGFARKPGMTRMDLLKSNAGIIKEVAQNVAKYCKDSIVITVTNPMDVMNYIVYKITGFPRKHVIGMGGLLDSSRYREILAEMLNVGRSAIRALVIGEHGENMLPMPRYSTLGGIRISDILNKEQLALAEENTRKIAAEVISLKGATVFAPISCIATMVENIIKDKKDIIPASVYLEGEYGLKDICIGVPIILGRNGWEQIIELNLNEEEREKFLKGANTIYNAIEELKKEGIIQ